MIKFTLLIILLLASSLSLDPILWPERFTQYFSQGDSKTQIYTSGQIWYDIANNRQRCEVKNDYYDLLCSSVSQSTNSTCSQVIMNGKLYIWLPEQNKCCMCCTSAEGCKITERDWLRDYQYIGIKGLSWDFFYVWTHYDMPVNTSYWTVMNDAYTPRRMDYGSYSIDFMPGTYSEDVIPDSVFSLPSYCEKDCPKTSFCANFRQGNLKYRNIFTAPKKITGNSKISSE